jgi:acid phosphatase
LAFASGESSPGDGFASCHVIAIQLDLVSDLCRIGAGQSPIDGLFKGNAAMRHRLAMIALTTIGVAGGAEVPAAQQRTGIENVQTVVVIYAENRSFDNLYGLFPGANGLQNATPAHFIQIDRDGTVLKELPPVWGGLTAPNVAPAITQAQTEGLPNRPFAIDGPDGFKLPLSVATRDLWHRFYQNQMQIHGGENDRFVAYSDSGALVMGHYDGSKLPLWNWAQQYALADNFFQGAFGGSFLNHFQLVCACTPFYPDADKSPARSNVSVVSPDRASLALEENSAMSALDGIPKFKRDCSLTPDFFAVNTMQPPYPPTGVPASPFPDRCLTDPVQSAVLPPQHEITIGDLLTLKGISWAWYAGAWQATLDDPLDNEGKGANFQNHHQPFNYFSNFAPGASGRAQHLRDGGLGGSEFIKAIDSGQLPEVTFYKPQGTLNEHAGYADVMSGDEHIADLLAHLKKGPQWPHMLIVVAYDENGGFWDHVAPPKADRWGPGTRIPALIISPFAKGGFVDHTQYDTTSILRFVTRRYQLPVLPGLLARDRALQGNGYAPMGDLTNSLTLL